MGSYSPNSIIDIGSYSLLTIFLVSSPGYGAARVSSRKQPRRKAMNKNNFMMLASGLMFHCLIMNFN
jgi:hypothetical protein